MRQIFRNSFLGLLMLSMGTVASASTITYDTMQSFFTAGTGVSPDGQSIVIADGNGVNATLTYSSLAATAVAVPPTSNISYGFFTLTYLGDAPYNPATGGGVGSVFFPAFSFHLLINDITDSKISTVIGTAAASTLSFANSAMNLSFVPTTVTSGTTVFTINSFTQIPPTSSFAGQVSLQGTLGSTAAPEPGTISLMGFGLIGIGFAFRRRFIN